MMGQGEAFAARRVTLVGAGNIGSFAAGFVARMPGVTRLTLVDPDRYSPENVVGQDISRQEVGLLKVEAQVRRLRRINPALDLEAIPEAAGGIALGRLRADVMLGCVDGRAARQHLNEIAWRLGVPWIDAGVLPSQGLVRVSVFVPGRGRPCLECGWHDADYAALEQVYACREGRPPSSAPSSRGTAPLGALAASLQGMVLGRMQAGEAAALAGRQVVFDGTTCTAVTTRLPFNPDCRFPDHEPWSIRPLPARVEAWPLARLFQAGEEDGLGPAHAVSLSVHGSRFATQARCVTCGTVRPVLCLERAWRTSVRACGRCGGERFVTGFDLTDRLRASALVPRQLSRSLQNLGILPGDVLTLTGDGGTCHFEVGFDAGAGRSAAGLAGDDAAAPAAEG